MESLSGTQSRKRRLAPITIPDDEVVFVIIQTDYEDGSTESIGTESLISIHKTLSGANRAASAHFNEFSEDSDVSDEEDREDGYIFSMKYTNEEEGSSETIIEVRQVKLEP